MSSANFDCTSMSGAVSTPQVQSYTSSNSKAISTLQRHSSHRLENASGVYNSNIVVSPTSHFLPTSSIQVRVCSPDRRIFSLDNQGFANVDAATIHAWRHNVGQNNQDGSRKLSPPASPSLRQNATFDPSAPTTVTAKCSGDFSVKPAAAVPDRVQRALLARGNSEVSKQCIIKPTSMCEASNLEAKRQKDLVVTEKMIGKWMPFPI